MRKRALALLSATVISLGSGSVEVLAQKGQTTLDHGGPRGASYKLALAAKAEARARARAAREARSQEAAGIKKYSRMYGSRVGRWYPLVHKYFPGYEADALYVIRGESGGNPLAHNGAVNGLFQIHSCHAGRFREVTDRPYFNGVYQPEANIKFAGYMSNHGRNWSAWSVRP